MRTDYEQIGLDEKWVMAHFLHQIGRKNVYNYILNQEEHDQKQTFREEQIALLDEFKIPSEEGYLFDNFLYQYEFIFFLSVNELIHDKIG